MDEDYVGVLGLDLVEMRDDFSRIGRLLSTRDGDERSLREVGRVLAVLFRPLEIARLDDGGGQFAGLRDVRSSPRAPDLAGLCAVGLCGGVPELLEGVATFREVVGPVGREFEFAGPDLRAVLLALQFADAGDEPVSRSVEPLCLGVEGVDEAPQEVRPAHPQAVFRRVLLLRVRRRP